MRERGDKVFPNLEAEMARRKITRKSLAQELHMTVNTIGRKLNGNAPLTLGECMKIKEILNVDILLEDLFKSSDTKK